MTEVTFELGEYLICQSSVMWNKLVLDPSLLFFPVFYLIKYTEMVYITAAEEAVVGNFLASVQYPQ